MRHKLGVALALALVISGCTKKAEGQIVAIVNGEEITAAELNAELQRANVPAGADVKQGRARVLQALIDRRIVAQQAREDGLDKSPEFLNQQRRATEDLLIRMLVNRQTATRQLPSEQQVADFITKNPRMFADREQWDLEQLRFVMPTDQEQLKNLDAAQSLEAVKAILTEAGITFTPAKTKLDTAIIPADIYGRIATSPAGKPFIIPVGGQGVASAIAAREAAPLTGEAARPIAAAVMRRQNAGEFMQQRLKALRQTAKIEYQAGYAPPTAK